MTSVTRVSSGEIIQVRTGVIQGIGPQGPVGPTGPQGKDGPQGTQGVPGPTGAIQAFSSQFTASAQGIASTTITSNVPTAYSLVAFATVVRDELTAQTSTTSFDVAAGDYSGIVYLQFQKQPSTNASGFRSVQVQYAGSPLVTTTVDAVTSVHTDMTVRFSFRSTVATDTLQIKVAHNEGVSLTVLGNLWLNLTGPGAQGPAGPQGIQGSVGPVGPQGPVGPAGSLVNNTTTFANIGGDDS